MKSQWANAPEVVVAENMDDPAIPEAVRAHNKEAIAKGAKGSPKGFFYKGKAYILADSMMSSNDAMETLFHESLGHYGLRGTFGPEMGKVLADVVKNRRADVEAKAKQYGLDVNSKEDMLEAAEEVLAEIAQTKPGLSFIKRAITVIRNFLRDLGLPFKMSNDDIIQKYILPARAFVEKGESKQVEGVASASRAQGIRTGFYSQLQRSIADVPDRIANQPAQQWKAWLASNAPKLGIKKEEIEWSGINDYLDLRGKEKVTKDDLQSYLKDNGVKVSEVFLGGDATKSDLTARQVSEMSDSELRNLPGSDYFEPEDWLIFRDGDNFVGQLNGSANNPEEAVSNFREEADAEGYEDVLTEGGAKYEKYTLPGGENYREVLITLPAKTAGAKILSTGTNKVNGKPFVSFELNGERYVVEKLKDETDQQAIARRIGGMPERGKVSGVESYKSKHWDEPNVIAHIRVNDRTDADGNRVLFVEEVQSDWGQEGMKRGFEGSLQDMPKMSADELLKAHGRSMTESQRDWLQNFSDRWDDVSDEDGDLDALTAEFEDWVSKQKIKGLPRAPFVTKTEGWLNLALKRIAMMAVEGGYDKVAFVNGEQSAKRYDLSKSVGSVYYTQDGVGKGTLVAMPVGSTINDSARPVMEKDNVAPEELEDYIGKELAKKLLESPVIDGFHSVVGDGLKIGGEGMKAFYDQIVPQAFNKLLPKLGGDKLNTVNFASGEKKPIPPKSEIVSVLTQYGRGNLSNDEVRDELGVDVSDIELEEVNLSDPYDRGRGMSVIRDLAAEIIARNAAQKKMKQPGFDVTPKMRETIGAGVPMFEREGQGLKTDTAAFKNWFGDSKVVDENGEPLVVYHGTNKNITSFKANRPMWFSATPELANQFVGGGRRSIGSKPSRGSVMYPVYLSIQNPLDLSEMSPSDRLSARKVLEIAGVASDAAALRKLAQANLDSGYSGVADSIADKAGFLAERYAQADRLADLLDNKGLIDELRAAGFDGLRMTEDGSITYAAFEPTQIKSATGNKGTYDPTNPDIRYQREATQEAEAEPTKSNPTRQNIFGEPVLGTWSITVDPKMELQDGLIYKLLDKNIDVKRIVEAVKNTGKQIASQWNPYLQEELYHGRTANASQEFQDKEWLPLLKDMDKKGVTVGELEKYLLNRHAEDYNRLVAKRNPNRPEMQDGGSSVKTADARKYLAGLDKDTKEKYEELAKRIDGITKGTRQLLVDNGYEKEKTIKNWEDAFPNYVPLMREEADFDYNFASFGTGRGFDVRRDFSRSAMGSKRNVVDIIGNVISARNQAIALTEKNRVAQSVYGLALEAPNPDFWMAINPDLAEVREVERIKQKIAKYMEKKSDPSITDDELDDIKSSLDSEYRKLSFAKTKATEAIERVRRELIDLGIPEETISAVMQEPEQRILDVKKGEVVSRVNTKLRENDHVLATRINGEKRYVFFNPNDPRSKRAATALKNLDAQDLGTAMGMIAKATRWMASVNTQYNPIFGPYNFLRDVQSAALQLSTTELAGQQKEIAANVVSALRAIYSSLRKRRKGEAATGDMADLWKEFQKEGGQTGFKDNFSRTQDRTEALLNEMEKITEGKFKANARAVFDWLSDYNDSLENAVRLSAYKVAKKKFADEGFSDSEAKQKAASLAKNLTVNFNRKGDVATQMGALYAFFNASMQGTARMIETLKGPAGKKIMAGGLLLGSIQAAWLAAAGFDDEEPPEFIRSKNIVIPTVGGNYVAFPMPLGFHVIPGISRITSEWALSGFKDTARRVTDLTGLFLDAFNPIGNAGWSVQTITPTLLDPFVALGENKDWTGKPISKEDIFSLRPTPGYTRAREGANWLSIELSKFLNYASGGTKYQPGVLSPTPEQIEYLVGQAFGGVGREAIKLATTIEKTATGEELPPYKIPLYGRFVGETKSSAAESNRFYKNMERLNRLDLEIKGRRENREPIGDFMKENREARMLPMANKTYKDIQALRKRRTTLVERNAPKESVQAVEKLITRKMQMLNDRVRALEESN